MIRLMCSTTLVGATMSTETDVRSVTYFLKQKGAVKLLNDALEVSDPDSDRYGDFLSFEEVVDLQRPEPEHVQQLHAYLDTLGVLERKATVAGDKIVAAIPREANAFHESIASAVDGVLGGGGMWNLDGMKPRKGTRRSTAPQSKTNSSLPSCLSQSMVSADCLRSIYGLGDPKTVRSTHPSNLQAVIVNEQFAPSDLKYFLSENKIPEQQIVKLINGKTGGGATEASLDTQYIIAFGPGTPTWWMYINGQAENPFASWLTYMSNTSTIPLVQSLSVGAPEDAVGNTLVQRMNTEMAALGARGATIVFASGDSGYQQSQKFGAGSPFVTAVGGVWNGELGEQGYFSVDPQTTGGFSSLDANPQAAWQKAAVDSYLKTKGARPSGFNSSRRCVPDVSLFDADIEIVEGGQNSVCGGTSAAAPQLSGMFSLINDALLHKNHTSLGFINPLLYQNADAFVDITKGNNNGFEAVQGYDPASGLGTFSKTTVQKLISAAVAAKESAIARRAAKSQEVVV